MILSLHIENVAIIEKSDIDFSNGFNVLTGETGAGKSIIIDSINLLLGNKSSKNLIRTGCSFALVSAVFSGFNSYQISAFERNDINPDEDGNIIVTRKVTSDGRSYTKVNGQAVTVSTLKNISSLLVNIHGQHDGAKILNPANHIEYLDVFCDNHSLLTKYSEKVKAIRSKILELTEIKEKKEELSESLRFRIDEIENAKIVDGELKRLKESALVAQNITSILKALHACDEILNGEDGGILDSVSEAVSEISSVDKVLENSSSISEPLIRAKAELEDASAYISKKISDFDDFDMSPDYIESRIFLIEKIVSKYGSEQDALSALERFKNEFSKLEYNEFELEETTELYKSAIIELERIASELSDTRQKYAKKLSRDICAQLSEIDMPNIKFETSITRNQNSRGGNKYTAVGFDCVEFLISPNAGQDLRPLSKIASGGELSRIMLCLKSILNGSKDECSTVIYDEIDTGVSGSTAQKIGIKLEKSADNKQVFSITHLAQIAALADNHYKVEKQTDNDVTTSNIRLLDDRERVLEVARIMGGVEISDQIIKSAEELIKNSKKC